MRYALISDIHGNLPALEAVIDDAKNKRIDKYVFLGDYFLSVPYPNEVASVLRNFEHAFVVSGNEERHIENLEKQDFSTWKKGQFSALHWSYKNLSTENKSFLKTLPVKTTIKDPFSSIFAFHSAAEYFNGTILTDLKSSTFALATKLLSENEFIASFKNRLNCDENFNSVLSKLPDGIYAYGHNHIQTSFKFGKKLLINPGSCGMPLDYPGFAPYTIVETGENKIDVQELRIEYDIKSTIDNYRKSDLYKNARVWSEIIIKELATGREYVKFFLDFVNEYANNTNDPIRPYSSKTWEEAYEIWSGQN